MPESLRQRKQKDGRPEPAVWLAPLARLDLVTGPAAFLMDPDLFVALGATAESTSPDRFDARSQWHLRFSFMREVES